MAKITYTDKVKIKDIPVAEVNKFTADNANEIKTIVNELDDIKDNIANKSQDVETDKLSITKYPSVKALYDWAVGKFQSILVSGTNIKTINGDSILGSGDITISGGGSGDMVLADAQTVSGLKTFLSGMLGLRNVANTFTSFFTNSNTAARTYTLKDRNGTLIDDTDYNTLNSAISGKMANPSGAANYLSKFLTATTIGLSSLWDTGTFLGIGTVNSPTKNITLGNQSDKEIGVEQSDSSTKGRNLVVRAGRTINFIDNPNFIALVQGTKTWTSTTTLANGNVYASDSVGNVYVQTGGAGAFVQFANIASGYIYDLATAPNGNVYAALAGNSIYMQTGGTGAFISLSQTARSWFGITCAPNGDVYACEFGGNIYKQTGGTGDFVTLSQGNRQWHGLAAAPNGDIYCSVYGGDIYKQTGGTGAFSPLGQTARNYRGMCASPNGNIYACNYGGDIYKQTGGTGAFNALVQTARNYHGICSDANNNIYVAVMNGDIYKQNNYSIGVANLDGGTLKQIAGTGKGTGTSRYEIYTGQKLASGTDMQIETLREYIDENGYHVYMSMPVYADNAAAIAGGLPIGCEYRTATGVKMIVY